MRTYQVTVIVSPLCKMTPAVGKVILGSQTTRVWRGAAVASLEKAARATAARTAVNFIVIVGDVKKRKKSCKGEQIS